jgi:Uma2 family endonuclease
MAVPARKPPTPWDQAPDDDEESGSLVLQWCALHPDGRVEIEEIPVTPELFLDPPPFEHKIVQGRKHNFYVQDLCSRLAVHFTGRQDVLILSDVKHYLGVPRLPAPCPDVSVIQGLPFRDLEPEIFDVAVEGVRPSLIIEVVSPKDPEIRKMDMEKKPRVYARAGIPEYIYLDPPRRKNGRRIQLVGHRLGARGRYRAMKQDAEGRLVSETTGLLFSVSAKGDQVVIVEAATGRELLPVEGLEDARKAAEKKAEREEAARKAAEAEIARLRDELARLKKGG